MSQSRITPPPSPTAPPQRSPRHMLMGIAVAAFVLAGLLGLYKLTLGRAPLIGETHHDFGYIRLTQPPSPVRHVFQLTNRTGSTIHIEDVRASCGCTATDLSTRAIEPGETLELTASLTLTNVGQKSSSISIVMADRGAQTLTLEGIGRLDERLRASRAFLPIAPERPAAVTIFADIWPDDELFASNANGYDDIPEPTLKAPEGFLATLSQWSLRRMPNAHEGRPAIWSGTVDVVMDAEHERADSAAPPALTVTLGTETLEIPLPDARSASQAAPPPQRGRRALPSAPPTADESAEPDDAMNPLEMPPDIQLGTPPASTPDGR